MSRSLYAILEVEAQAYKNGDQQINFHIFVNNGNNINDVAETRNDASRFRLRSNVHRPGRTVEMIMTIPEKKDLVLGMVWLREHKPDVNWETLHIKPRNPTARPIRVKYVVRPDVPLNGLPGDVVRMWIKSAGFLLLSPSRSSRTI
ncbi:hypothetical protein PHMEG_00022493 [Phytophthora megakarya]|uniref:Uncharacterized protein n=1 Tax=Phytophthora megakarya TaxID=4795 RepID=A0A225VJ27_9STRA|nr:hypothetical protein PHMEG_00022493 [Phytophthora megakarya]